MKSSLWGSQQPIYWAFILICVQGGETAPAIYCTFVLIWLWGGYITWHWASVIPHFSIAFFITFLITKSPVFGGRRPLALPNNAIAQLEFACKSSSTLLFALQLSSGKTHGLVMNQNKWQLGFPQIAICSNLVLNRGFSKGKQWCKGKTARTCAWEAWDK